MQGISKEKIKVYNDKFYSNCQNQIMSNVLANNEMINTIKLSERKPLNRHEFAIDIQTMKACNQKNTGRCWIFAALNVLREIVAKKCDIKEFELSQSYVAFYDKLEKINYKLENIIELCDRDYDDRTLSHILSEGIQDGGQWDMFVNVVKKYGIVPKSAFDETYQSSNTRQMNYVIATKIRQFASVASKLYKENKKEEIRVLKEEVLEQLYLFLCMNYGVPVEKFDFEYVDKGGNYHLEEDFTPLSFFEKFIGNSLDDYVSIINAPTEDKPFNKMFTVKYVGNVIDGKEIEYLNLEINEFKELCLKQLRDREVVWFGSDCGKYGDGFGVWDDKMFDYKNTFGIDINIEKGEMLKYKSSAMDHAMVITGVSFKNNLPSKWKIENSWGTEKGNNGYYLMSDSWFDKFVYQAVINKKYLSDKQLEYLKQEKIALQPWDPMGTLA